MELRHFRYFVAVAEEENVTRAAARLHVTQPGLSRQIRDLEEEIGFALLERSAKAVRLTEAGREFLLGARATLERAEEAVRVARARAGGLQGELQIGYAPSLTVEILPRALRRFEASFPGLRVVLHDLSSEEILSRLLAGKLDLGLTVPPVEKMLRGLRFVELARYPLRVAVAPTHALARKRNLTLAQVGGERLIGYSRKEYPEYHLLLTALFKESGAKPHLIKEHDSVTSLIADVEAGRGLALVPSCLECMVGPRLKLIPVVPSGSPIVVGAVVRQGKPPVSVEEFITAALQQGK